MRTTQQLSITLPKDMADMVKAKVRGGQYASESEVIRDGLRTLMARDRAVDSWLHRQVGQVRAGINPDELSDDEQELYSEKLGESYRAPSPIEDKVFADLRARGGLVGMDEEGNIIFSEPSKSNAP